jgi:hypothetical protein
MRGLKNMMDAITLNVRCESESLDAAFQRFQANIRASERTICESDLYFRADRWSSFFNTNKSNLVVAPLRCLE